MKWHPDKHEGDAKQKAEKNFMRIAKAYETLSDPEKVTFNFDCLHKKNMS